MTPHTGIVCSCYMVIRKRNNARSGMCWNTRATVAPAIVVRMDRDGSAGSTERSEAERGTVGALRQQHLRSRINNSKQERFRQLLLRGGAGGHIAALPHITVVLPSLPSVHHP
jgi:hypothetical protein